MENDENDFGNEDVLQHFFDKLKPNQSLTINAGDMVRRIALNSEKSVEVITTVIRVYIEVLIYSDKDEPDFNEQEAFFVFSHLDNLDRFELTYSKDANGKVSIEIGLLPEKQQNKLYS